LRGHRRGQHGIAGGRIWSPATKLGEDQRPGRIATGAEIVEAAQARGLAGDDERADHADRFGGGRGQVRDRGGYQGARQLRRVAVGEHGQVRMPLGRP